MKKRINGLLTLLLVLVTQITFAQDMNISGVVSDSNGMPIPGANVKVKGTSSGTQTDFDGSYKIKAKSSDVLVFSFTGMNSQELKVSGARMNARLSSKATELEGVVVTALGIKREKKSLGYASQELKGDQVNSVPTTNFVNNLSGKVAGLEIRQSTNFGGSTNVVLRGIKSIRNSNQALFVIDGIPITNANVNDGDQLVGRRGFDFGNAAADINPNDIASLNVLKGAAATALYGSRGANGVIMITTKKGKYNSDLSLEFSSSFTTATVDKATFPEYQTEYGQGYTGKFSGIPYLGGTKVRFGDDASYGPRYDNSSVYQYGAFIPGSPTFGQKTPWQIAKNGPITFFNTGTTTVNNLTLSGGTEKAIFRFNYGNTNTNDILPNGYLNKNNFSGSTTYKFNDKLSATFNASYSTQFTRGRNTTGYSDNIMSNFRQWWPTNIDLKDQQNLYELSNQNYTWNIKNVANIDPLYWNNVYFDRYQNYETDTRKRLSANASISYDVNKNVNFLARVGTDGFTLKVDERRAVGSIPAEFGNASNGANVQPAGYALSLYDYSEQNYDFITTLKKDLSQDLNVSLVLGSNFSARRNTSNQQSTSGGLFIPGLYTISNSLSAPSLPIPSDLTKNIWGLFTQGSIGYKSTYFIEGTYRSDQSSALAEKNNRYGYYSLSTSLVFSNWSIFKDSKVLRFGKIRAAIAQVGNDLGANQLKNTYTPRNPFGGSALYSYNTSSKSNKVTSERTDNYEFGIETMFLNNRFGFEVSYFKNRSFDQILQLPVSFATGSATSLQNAGTLETKGVEVTLTATPLKSKNFSWDVIVNWSNPKTKVTELAPGIENIELGSLQGGVSINAPINQEYGSIFGSTYELAPNGQRIIASNGAYLSTTTTNNNLGSYQPEFLAGFTNKFTYKNVSFSFLIDWRKGGKVFSLDQYYGYGTGLYPDSVGNNDLGNPVRNTLTNVNPGGVVLDGVMDNPAYTPTNGLQQYITNTTRLDKSMSSQVLGTDPPTAAFVYDASFVKLREVQISYSMPSKLLQNTYIKGASFSIIGNNLWLISKNLPYSDPEAGLSSGNIQGYQSGPMPLTRNISFNLKMNF